jgi:hypothetical protein
MQRYQHAQDVLGKNRKKGEDVGSELEACPVEDLGHLGKAGTGHRVQVPMHRNRMSSYIRFALFASYRGMNREGFSPTFVRQSSGNMGCARILIAIS